MVVRIAHEDEHTRIEVHPDQHLVRLTWKGSGHGKVYRETLLRLLEIVQGHGVKYWLSDGRKMGPILFADEEWSMKEFTPLLVKAGIERIAIVSSEDVLNRIAVDRMVNATSPSVPYSIAFFQDPSIAQLWLLDPKADGVREQEG